MVRLVEADALERLVLQDSAPCVGVKILRHVDYFSHVIDGDAALDLRDVPGNGPCLNDLVLSLCFEHRNGGIAQLTTFLDMDIHM